MSISVSSTLLTTKFHIPNIRSAQVARPGLLAQLDSQIGVPLILIAAGAGFGKTSLIAAWSNQHRDRFCWLSLDTADNDPVRFFS